MFNCSEEKGTHSNCLCSSSNNNDTRKHWNQASSMFPLEHFQDGSPNLFFFPPRNNRPVSSFLPMTSSFFPADLGWSIVTQIGVLYRKRAATWENKNFWFMFQSVCFIEFRRGRIYCLDRAGDFHQSTSLLITSMSSRDTSIYYL